MAGIRIMFRKSLGGRPETEHSVLRKEGFKVIILVLALLADRVLIVGCN